MGQLIPLFSDEVPDYLFDMGLDYSPFVNVAEDHLEYSSVAEKKFWNWLDAITQNTAVMNVLLGPSSSSKAACLQCIGGMTPTKWYTSRHHASTLKTPTHLLLTLAKDLNITLEEGFSPEENIRKLVANWASLKDRGMMPVLMIDDAHLLSPALLELLLRLSQLTTDQYKTGLLHLILFSAGSLQGPMLAIDYCRKNIHKIIELSILGLLDEMTEEYLSSRLHKAGYFGRPIFSTAEIRLLTRQSAGSSGKLNKLAHEMLMKKMGRYYPHAAPPPDKSWTKAIFGTGSAAMLGLALMVFNVLREPIDNYHLDESTVMKIVAPIIIDSSPEIYTEKIRSSSQKIQTLNVVKELALTEENSVQKIKNEAISSLENLVSEQSLVSVAPKEVTPAPAEDNAGTLENQLPLKLANKWLMERDPGHYTIQLVGAAHHAALQTFIVKNGLSDKAVLLHTRKFDKIWYSVIQGDFTSHAAAKLAIKQLDPDFIKYGPWPRNFAAIQHEMKTISR